MPRPANTTESFEDEKEPTTDFMAAARSNSSSSSDNCGSNNSSSSVVSGSGSDSDSISPLYAHTHTAVPQILLQAVHELRAARREEYLAWLVLF